MQSASWLEDKIIKSIKDSHSESCRESLSTRIWWMVCGENVPKAINWKAPKFKDKKDWSQRAKNYAIDN